MLLFISGIINEWRLYLRQPSVWLSLLIVPGFAFLLAQGLSVEGDILTKRLTLLNNASIMLTLPIAVGLLTPSLLQRDHISQMAALIYVTPSTALSRYIYRASAFFSLLMLLMAISVILQVATIAPSLSQTTGLLGITLQNLIVLDIPILLLFTAIAMLCGRCFNSPMPTYFTLCIVWVSYVMLASVNGAPILAGSKIVNPQLYFIMSWLDPYGFTDIYRQIEQNANWAITPKTAVNRLIYGAMAIAMLYLSRPSLVPTLYPALPPISGGETTGWRKMKGNTTYLLALPFTKLLAPLRYNKRAIVTCNSIQLLIRPPSLLMAYFIYAGMVFSEVLSAIDYAEPFATIFPTSADALGRIVWDVMPFGGFVLMSIWAWQLCWHSKAKGIDELTAATPITNLQLIAGQCFALVFMWAAFLLLTATATLIAELYFGSSISLLTYCATLLLTGLPVLLFGLLCIAIHHLSPAPLIGGALCSMLILIKFSSLMGLFGIPHPLWDISGTPLQPAKLRVGFEMSISALLPFLLYWLVICVTLLAVAICRTHRGTGYTHLMSKGTSVPLVTCMLLILSATVFMHSALKQERALMMPNERHLIKANYEQRFQHWQQIPQPVVSKIDATVHFYPQKGYADIALNVSLKNNNNTPIHRVLIGNHPDFLPNLLQLEHAKLLSHDTQTQQRIFAFSRPLKPNEERLLMVNLRVENQTLWTSPTHHVVTEPFSYLRGVPLIPHVGFNDNFTLADPTLRKEYGLLPQRFPLPSELTQANRNANSEAKPIILTSTVIAPVNYHVVAPGELSKTWTIEQQGQKRRVFRFETGAPISAIPAWIATTFKNTKHPLVVAKRPLMLNMIGTDDEDASKVHIKAVEHTLSWFENEVAPYPYNQLNMVFAPDLGPSGYALPQVLIFDHLLSMRAKPTTPHLDQRYRRAVHEIAHQWFGHQLGFGLSADSSLLIESLAKYVELVMLEKHYGKDAMNALIEYEKRRYQQFQQRYVGQPVAFINASETPDIYSRATLVFAQFRQRIGDKPITDSLQHLFEQQRMSKAPVAAIDFVRQLKQHTEVQYHADINRLFLAPGYR
ncbi:hypothetical protein GTH32_06985 [Alteromonas sp. 345S023]|uniref:Peptidase M1 membrane alanine aminopeptidase domain-containing protein n=1 Tax=Alteromonas profundi TaxID=2696062 RepID=A0A7X5RKR8_9ALTE|nr:M1 family aminopeptidase [Alteromonas profundi]NDV90944.1 hypothetical protein [Alteromonas profundi]